MFCGVERVDTISNDSTLSDFYCPPLRYGSITVLFAWPMTVQLAQLGSDTCGHVLSAGLAQDTPLSSWPPAAVCVLTEERRSAPEMRCVPLSTFITPRGVLMFR